MVELSKERIEQILHEETRSLLRYYYMDIPQDICTQIEAFEDEYLFGKE